MPVDQLYKYTVRRTRISFAHEGAKGMGPVEIADFIKGVALGLDRETFYAIFLDVQLNVLGFEVVAVGGLSSVDVHPREVFRGALLAGAANVVVAHNHPGGSLEHSKDDLALVERLKASGDILGVPVLDSIVVTDGGHSSLADEKVDAKVRARLRRTIRDGGRS